MKKDLPYFNRLYIPLCGRYLV